MKTSKTWIFAAVALALPLTAQAHKAWLLPSETVLSAKDPWITVDAAVSNDLFYFNHVPLKLDALVITAPDGSTVQAENVATGKYRSTFDVHLTQAGTYRIALFTNAVAQPRGGGGGPGGHQPGAGRGRRRTSPRRAGAAERSCRRRASPLPRCPGTSRPSRR